MPRRHRKMKGGLFGFGESDNNNSWWSSISQTASNAWNKTRNATTNAYNSATGTPQTSTITTTTPVVGGKTRRKKMRGGNLAANAAPISGIKNAQPQTWVGQGGKTKRHSRRHKKSHRKH